MQIRKVNERDAGSKAQLHSRMSDLRAADEDSVTPYDSILQMAGEAMGWCSAEVEDSEDEKGYAKRRIVQNALGTMKPPEPLEPPRW